MQVAGITVLGAIEVNQRHLSLRIVIEAQPVHNWRRHSGALLMNQFNYTLAVQDVFRVTVDTHSLDRRDITGLSQSLNYIE